MQAFEFWKVEATSIFLYEGGLRGFNYLFFTMPIFLYSRVDSK